MTPTAGNKVLSSMVETRLRSEVPELFKNTGFWSNSIGNYLHFRLEGTLFWDQESPNQREQSTRGDPKRSPKPETRGDFSAPTVLGFSDGT